MTAALAAHRLSSAAVASLLVLEASYADPPPLVDRSTVEGLRGGAVVLMVAAFENYLKEAFAEALDDINKATPPVVFAKLPTALQSQVVYTGLESAMKAKPWDPIKEKTLRLPFVLNAVQRINRGEILSAEIASTAGNPDAAQVKAIFKVIDYQAVFTKVKPAFDAAWGAPTAQTFLEDTLDAVVQRRHVVAHTASILSTSRKDLADWHTFLNTFVGVLDAALVRHVKRVSSRAV